MQVTCTVAAMYPFRNKECSHGTHFNQLLKGSESQNNGPGLILNSCLKSYLPPIHLEKMKDSV